MENARRRARRTKILGVLITALGLLLFALAPQWREMLAGSSYVGGLPAWASAPTVIWSLGRALGALVVVAGLLVLALGIGYGRGLEEISESAG
ncbi:hypothetical protein GC722_07000 [Auraticoccus sp. F435]|uniref:Uncharacterized protein n=1 Tax=Auraticoccus cholistanensis TaxID=2656650 RepID=A0A6A9USI5_9ACTN|nr:hypothetical protein [Auraticoccus cholistanensis]MVA75773.1 hypothetical protein [Auraticoccus cholistanensis]